jgi:hypothetical protein
MGTQIATSRRGGGTPGLGWGAHPSAAVRRRFTPSEWPAAVSNAHFFDNTQYVFSDLHTWGWITIIVGVIGLGAGVSLMRGGGFGRVIGIIAATIGALKSLLSIGGTHPWWSLAIFALCLFILHGLVVYGDEAAPQT